MEESFQVSPRLRSGVETAASGLFVLSAVVFVFHLFAPAHWTGLAVLVLVLAAVGLRIEAAIRSIRTE